MVYHGLVIPGNTPNISSGFATYIFKIPDSYAQRQGIPTLIKLDARAGREGELDARRLIAQTFGLPFASVSPGFTDDLRQQYKNVPSFQEVLNGVNEPFAQLNKRVPATPNGLGQGEDAFLPSTPTPRQVFMPSYKGPTVTPTGTGPKLEIQKWGEDPPAPEVVNPNSIFAKLMGEDADLAEIMMQLMSSASQGMDITQSFNAVLAQLESFPNAFMPTDKGPVLNPTIDAAIAMMGIQSAQATGQMNVTASLMSSLFQYKSAIKVAELSKLSVTEAAQIQADAAMAVANANNVSAEKVAALQAASAEAIARATGESAESVARIQGDFQLQVARQTGIDQRAIAEINAASAAEVARIQSNPFNFTQEQQLEIERIRATGGLTPEQILQQERIRAGASLIPTLVNLRSNPAALGSLVATGGLEGVERSIAELSGTQYMPSQYGAPQMGGGFSSSAYSGTTGTPRFQSLGGFSGAPQNMSAYDIRGMSDENIEFITGQAASSGITPSGLSNRILSNTPQGL